MNQVEERMKNMDTKKMEETGVYDYYEALNKWINYFVNKNYPLSKEDFKALADGTTTQNIINREKVFDILKNELECQLSKQQELNANMLENMENGTYTPYTVDNLNSDIEKMQQEMLEKLWNEQHHEFETSENIEEINGKPQEGDISSLLVNQVTEISEEMDIRATEISEANAEINNIEKDFIQQQQMSPQDMGMNIGK